ncbi:MAG TPA: hypothetical protein VMM57_06200 [Bacteroidota bacterium]|nr:hypothetical protein [Bacteroidota bacterium]
MPARPAIGGTQENKKAGLRRWIVAGPAFKESGNPVYCDARTRSMK